MKTKVLIFALVFFQVTFGQLSKSTKKNLLKHIQVLSSDSLGGRETGTEGETKAINYIVSQFKKLKIKPAYFGEYAQPFKFIKNIEALSTNYCKINYTKKLVQGDQYWAIDGSGNGIINSNIFDAGFGIHAPDLGYSSYSNSSQAKGRVFLIKLGDPDNNAAHSKYYDYISINAKVETAIKFGAVAVVFTSEGTSVTAPTKVLKTNTTAYSIPVIYTTEKLKSGDIFEANIQLKKTEAEGHNVLGYIDNKSKYTIVIGAHYDHLGLGDHGSLYRGVPAIHNGADDNASGISLMIELAAVLKKKKLKHNVLFIAFSGEELGLYGSKNFVESSSFRDYQFSYMLNMDMVGRLDSAEKTLIVNGVGTSPDFGVMKNIKTKDMKITTTESGVGPSDHTSFYFKDVPVLHFFSGTHADYHKPTDDWQLINLNGMVSIGNYMLSLITALDKKDTLTFSKTKEETQQASSFKVTMGVVPDYTYTGEGMKIDGVSDGKPAANAGLKSGDIIIEINGEKIKDIYAYMSALGKYNKGEEVPIKVKRGTEIKDFKIKF